MFGAKKARHYVTYWNWACQDLFGYINQSILEGKRVSSEQMLMLQNRSHPALIGMTEGYLAVLKKQPGVGLHNTTSMLREVIDNCKASLETLLNRWTSESWSEYLSVIGTVIGWTRGTNMMDTNDILACKVERRGTRTFSTSEMAFNILCLLHPDMRDLSMDEPVWADLSGGFQGITRQMNDVLAWRTELLEQSAMRKAIISAHAKEHAVVSGGITSELSTLRLSDPLAKSSISFPEIKSYEQLEHLHHLEGMVNLDKVVVVTGYGEVGPLGHSATRWEIEAYGELSHEGAIEFAWLMGLIKRHNAPLPTGTQTYVGWVDAKTGKLVRDRDIKKLYEPYIIEHTGIRLLEPEQADGTDPSKLTVLREIQILHDMEPFDVKIF